MTGVDTHLAICYSALEGHRSSGSGTCGCSSRGALPGPSIWFGPGSFFCSRGGLGSRVVVNAATRNTERRSLLSWSIELPRGLPRSTPALSATHRSVASTRSSNSRWQRSPIRRPDSSCNCDARIRLYRQHVSSLSRKTDFRRLSAASAARMKRFCDGRSALPTGGRATTALFTCRSSHARSEWARAGLKT